MNKAHATSLLRQIDDAVCKRTQLRVNTSERRIAAAEKALGHALRDTRGSAHVRRANVATGFPTAGFFEG